MTPDKPPSLLVFGTGGMGALCAYLFSHAFPQGRVCVVCRSNYEAVKLNGLTINSSLWGTNIVIRPSVFPSVEAVLSEDDLAFDYVVVTTKAFPLAEGKDHPIKPVVSPHTAIVLVQNGVGIEEPYRQRFPDNPIISTVVYAPVTQVQPGVFSHTLLARLYLGTYPRHAPEGDKIIAKSLANALQEAGAVVTYEEDIQFERWRKLLINAAGNPICALTRLPDARFVHSAPGAEELFRDVMAEIASVAQADGYANINDEMVQNQLDYTLAKPLPGVEPSMMSDALAGRQMEVEAILGNPIKIAQRHGVSTPILKTLYYLINGLNQSFQGRGTISNTG